MHTTKKDLIAYSLGVMMLGLVTCLNSCAPQKIVVIPADRMIHKLPNGNYEVTPAWLQERYDLERWQKVELKKCNQ